MYFEQTAAIAYTQFNSHGSYIRLHDASTPATLRMKLALTQSNPKQVMAPKPENEHSESGRRAKLGMAPASLLALYH